MRPAKYLMRLLRNRLLEYFFFCFSSLAGSASSRGGTVRRLDYCTITVREPRRLHCRSRTHPRAVACATHVEKKACSVVGNEFNVVRLKESRRTSTEYPVYRCQGTGSSHRYQTSREGSVERLMMPSWPNGAANHCASSCQTTTLTPLLLVESNSSICGCYE